MASLIEDYGLIGNLNTAALVSSNGSIDWLCAPRFDSDACFSAVVGYDTHGRWAINPTVPVRERRPRYRGDTLILETEVVCDGGAVRLIDFMPIADGQCQIVRLVEGLEGEVPLEMMLDVRFGYGANTPWLRPLEGGYSFTAGPDAAFLRSEVEVEPGDGGVSAYFTVKKGERRRFTLSVSPSHLADPPPVDPERALDETERYWREWAGRCTYVGPYRDAVLRSLITLKALTYAPTGAIIAAPTTSLPEALGGVRNWDYRFCWLRDTSLTLSALVLGGYVEEATAFRDWLLRAVAGNPRETQIMYDINGGRRLTEFELDWLPGYEDSKPVRIGNAASDQLQLDVFGEVLAAAYLARKAGLPARPEAFPARQALVQYVSEIWQQPDDGIWEVRSGRRHFTYSKIMAWVAIDRAVRLIEEFGDGGAAGAELLPRLSALRSRIHEEICARGFHPGVGAFTQSYGSAALDASVLLMPHMGFLPAHDPRVQGTVRAVERTLLRDGFVLRYQTGEQTDGLPGSEGAFLACTFWLADNYAFAGRVDEAQELFERLLSLRTPLGLLAEEYEPSLHRLIGNFPQGFSHLALITSASVLDAAIRGERASETRRPAA